MTRPARPQMPPARRAPVGSSEGSPSDSIAAAAESDHHVGRTAATCSGQVTGARGPGVGQWGPTEAPRGRPRHPEARTTTPRPGRPHRNESANPLGVSQVKARRAVRASGPGPPGSQLQGRNEWERSGNRAGPACGHRRAAQRRRRRPSTAARPDASAVLRAGCCQRPAAQPAWPRRAAALPTPSPARRGPGSAASPGAIPAVGIDALEGGGGGHGA